MLLLNEIPRGGGIGCALLRMVRRREVRGSVTDAVKAVTPTAAVGIAADVMSDISDRHIPPIMSMLTCEKGIPLPHALKCTLT